MSAGESERLGRIASLMRTIRDAERELQTLTAGKIDAAAGEGDEPLLLVEAQQRLLAQQLEGERARLVAAQRVAKVGSWETNLATLEVIWSDETHRIFER